jgi:hypothetical protein
MSGRYRCYAPRQIAVRSQCVAIQSVSIAVAVRGDRDPKNRFFDAVASIRFCALLSGR